MTSLEKLCEKFTVLNALEHGEAVVGAVIGLIAKSNPELRNEIENIKAIVAKKVSYINSLSSSEIQQLAQQQYPELLEEAIVMQRKNMP